MYWDGRAVACLYGAEASMIQLIAHAPQMSQEQLQLAYAQLDVAKCAASTTWQGMAAAGLLNVGIGWAIDIGASWLTEGAEGFPSFCGRCFAAGTPVHTEHGAVPIERLKVGDKVRGAE